MKKQPALCLYKEESGAGRERSGALTGQELTGSRVLVCRGRGIPEPGQGGVDQRITGTGASSFMVQSVTAQS